MAEKCAVLHTAVAVEFQLTHHGLSNLMNRLTDVFALCPCIHVWLAQRFEPTSWDFGWGEVHTGDPRLLSLPDYSEIYCNNPSCGSTFTHSKELTIAGALATSWPL